jgi:hypothetical protein
MALVSMDVKDDDDYSSVPDNPYGYGLVISLNDAQCAALGITTPPVAGTVVGIEARCIICSVTQEAEPGEDVPEIRMRLQITDLGIGGAQPGRTAADALYGPENE